MPSDPLVRGLIPYLVPLYMPVFEFCLSLLFAPEGSSQDNVEVGRKAARVRRSQTLTGVFRGGQIWLKVQSSFSIHKRALDSFSRPTAERTYSSISPQWSGPA